MIIVSLKLKTILNNKSNHLFLIVCPVVGIDFLILFCCSYCSDLGFLTVSSIDKIVQAASVAAFNAFIFTITGYHTNAS